MPISPEQLSSLIDSHWWALILWLGNGPDAEDVVQQTFIALATQEPTPDAPVKWLYRVARNTAINDGIQRARREKRHRQIAKQEANFQQTEQSLEFAELWEALNQLDPIQRETVVARNWGQLSFDQIAELLNRPKATVWRIHESAIAALKKIYGVNCES